MLLVIAVGLAVYIVAHFMILFTRLVRAAEIIARNSNNLTPKQLHSSG